MVYFWADWCGPCHMIFPVIEALASDFQGRIKVGKLDIDDNCRVAAQYGIRSIPTLLFFRNGRPEDHVVGVAPKRALAEKLHPLLQVQEVWEGVGTNNGAFHCVRLRRASQTTFVPTTFGQK